MRTSTHSWGSFSCESFSVFCQLVRLHWLVQQLCYFSPSRLKELRAALETLKSEEPFWQPSSGRPAKQNCVFFAVCLHCHTPSPLPLPPSPPPLPPPQPVLPLNLPLSPLHTHTICIIVFFLVCPVLPCCFFPSIWAIYLRQPGGEVGGVRRGAGRENKTLIFRCPACCFHLIGCAV